eukprot:m.196146 g.196146  ORF g.196146 m.196146 type:complete len:353 (+) comp14902_c1_seq3:57-1115(+)
MMATQDILHFLDLVKARLGNWHGDSLCTWEVFKEAWLKAQLGWLFIACPYPLQRSEVVQAFNQACGDLLLSSLPLNMRICGVFLLYTTWKVAPKSIDVKAPFEQSSFSHLAELYQILKAKDLSEPLFALQQLLSNERFEWVAFHSHSIDSEGEAHTGHRLWTRLLEPAVVHVHAVSEGQQAQQITRPAGDAGTGEAPISSQEVEQEQGLHTDAPATGTTTRSRSQASHHQPASTSGLDQSKKSFLSVPMIQTLQDLDVKYNRAKRKVAASVSDSDRHHAPSSTQPSFEQPPQSAAQGDDGGASVQQPLPKSLSHVSELFASRINAYVTDFKSKRDKRMLEILQKRLPKNAGL